MLMRHVTHEDTGNATVQEPKSTRLHILISHFSRLTLLDTLPAFVRRAAHCSFPRGCLPVHHVWRLRRSFPLGISFDSHPGRPKEPRAWERFHLKISNLRRSLKSASLPAPTAGFPSENTGVRETILILFFPYMLY